VTDLKNVDGCVVELFRQHEIGSSIVSLEIVSRVISESLKRAREQKEPMLKTCKGTWKEGQKETWIPLKNEN